MAEFCSFVKYTSAISVRRTVPTCQRTPIGTYGNKKSELYLFMQACMLVNRFLSFYHSSGRL